MAVLICISISSRFCSINSSDKCVRGTASDPVSSVCVANVVVVRQFSVSTNVAMVRLRHRLVVGLLISSSAVVMRFEEESKKRRSVKPVVEANCRK